MVIGNILHPDRRLAYFVEQGQYDDGETNQDWRGGTLHADEARFS